MQVKLFSNQVHAGKIVQSAQTQALCLCRSSIECYSHLSLSLWKSCNNLTFSARGAAESVETLDKLRQTRDTLNDILTENDQLKIEVTFDTFSCV